jgi:hypothetical protein
MWAWDFIVEGGVSTKAKAVVPISGLALAAGIFKQRIFKQKRGSHKSQNQSTRGKRMGSLKW